MSTIEWHIETHDSIPSTQDALKVHARAGKPEGTVVHAHEQTAGRGRHARKWISDKGNLFLSLLLKPPGEARHVGQMGLLAGLSVADTVVKYLEDPDILTLKWPNDVMLQGSKCAGILVETELTSKNALSWVGIGIGINIVTAPQGLGQAIEHYAVKTPSVISLRTSLLSNIDKHYLQWKQEGFEPIREKWLKYAHKPGSRIRVKVGTDTQEGIFQGIDDHGNLMMTDAGLNLRKIAAGEVY